jgi:hypothetical protein
MANVRGFVNTLSGLGFGAADARLEAERLKSQMELQRFDRERQRDQQEELRLQAINSVVNNLTQGGVRALEGMQEQEWKTKRYDLDKEAQALNKSNIEADNAREAERLGLQKEAAGRDAEAYARGRDLQVLEGLGEKTLVDLLIAPPKEAPAVAPAPKKTGVQVKGRTVTEYGKKGSTTTAKPDYSVPPAAPLTKEESLVADKAVSQASGELDQVVNGAVESYGFENGYKIGKAALRQRATEIQKLLPSLSIEEIEGRILADSKARAEEATKKSRESEGFGLQKDLTKSQIEENKANAARLNAAASVDASTKNTMKQLQSIESQIRSYNIKIADQFTPAEERDRLRVEVSRLQGVSDSLRSGIGMPPVYSGGGGMSSAPTASGSAPVKPVAVRFPDGSTHLVRPDEVELARRKGGVVVE